MKAKAVTIRDRVVGLRRVKARDLLPNDANWRRHGPAQRSALAGVLREIGYAGALLAYETPEGLRLIDGHLRAELTPNQEVPVLVLDEDEDEARKLLAVYDPLSAMAQPDNDALLALLQLVQFQDPAVTAMLEALANGETQPKPDLSMVRDMKLVSDGYDWEIDSAKLGYRLEAVAHCRKRERALEMFAGRGLLSYWYLRLFDEVLRVDADQSMDVDVHAKAEEFFALRAFDPSKPCDFVDFDDEGCPSVAIRAFFANIRDAHWPLFVLALTDGGGLALKVRGKLNLQQRYRLGGDWTVQGNAETWERFPEMVEHHLLTVSAEAGYQAKRISLYRGSHGNVVYACYEISEAAPLNRGS